MAKGKGEIKGWITKNGVHIPIYGHYSVRGGEEPKAKGAKFKGKKKRRPDTVTRDMKTGKVIKENYRDNKEGNWNMDHVRNDIFQSNTSVKEQADYIDYLHKKGKINDEEKATLAKELADRHKNRISEDVGNVTSSESKQAFDDKTPGRTAQRVKDAEKRVEIAKERNVLGQETDFAEVDRTAKEREKDFIVNTPIPEGKSWERAESKRKAMEAADEADAYDRQHKEGRYADRDFSSDLAGAHKAGYSEQKELPKTSKEWAQHINDKYFSDYPNYVKAGSIKRDAGEWMDTLKDNGASQEEIDAFSNFVNGKRSTPKSKNIEAIEWAGKYNPTTYKDVERAQQSSASERKFPTKKMGANKSVDTERRQTQNDAIRNLRDKGMGIQEASRTVRDMTTSERQKNAQEWTDKYGKGTTTNKTSAIKKESVPNPYPARKEAKALNLGMRDYNKFKSGSFDSMSLTGLKEAFANAGGSEKSKIRSELRKRGYTYVGGKWIKA